MTRFGSISLNKQHVLAGNKSFQMSAYLQERVCLVGQSVVFAEGSMLLDKLAGIEVNAKQIERVCHHYGQQLEEASQDESQDSVDQRDNGLHYGMVDGGMVLTREEGWKELKLGRVFAAESVLPENQHRNFIRHSNYVAHLGEHEPFFNKLSFLTDRLPNMVWIADGARWIWKWVEEQYPNAVQILDYFHAKEKLCELAQLAFCDEQERSQWIQQQEDLLFQDAITVVLANIALMSLKGAAKQKQQALLKYYQNNEHRMQYATFRKQGYLIGSGPIEGAIRQVIQQRLKLSGQRWTKKGAQQVANLRVAQKSAQWQKVLQTIENSA